MTPGVRCGTGAGETGILRLRVLVLANRGGTPVQDLDLIRGQTATAAQILGQYQIQLDPGRPEVVRVPDHLLDFRCGGPGWLFMGPAILGQANRQARAMAFPAPARPGPTLTAVFVRDVINGRGCYHWPATFIVVDGSGGGRTLAHEIGHANGLGHVNRNRSPNNLMVMGGSGTGLTERQCRILHSGRFVTHRTG